MEPMTSKLRRTRLFSGLPEAGLIELIERPGIQSGEALAEVPACPGDLVVLLEGGLHMLARDGSGDQMAILSVDAGAPEPAILYTIPPAAVLKLTRPSVYLIIDGGRLDQIVSGAQEQRSLATLDDAVRERVAALIRAPLFKRLTFDQVVRCAAAMQSVEVAAGEIVIEEGRPGDCFYVIESGHAEVIRGGVTGADGRREVVAMLPAGSSFGEEALLRNAPRNATIRILRSGRLLRLERSDFDRLLKSELVHAIPIEEARLQLRHQKADAIDCRCDEEWELWRLPGARLIPLETIRERARSLDAGRRYIVYCRSGRRSSAAVFLMRQLGLDARFLEGGISAWPYELEGTPIGG